MGNSTESQDCNTDRCKYLKDVMVWGVTVGDTQSWNMDAMKKCCCDKASGFEVHFSS